MHVDVVFIDDDSQAGASLGFEVEGSVESVLYDANGAVVEQASSPLDTTFVMRPGPDDRWLIVAEQGP
jgi:hypothetical protein